MTGQFANSQCISRSARPYWIKSELLYYFLICPIFRVGQFVHGSSNVYGKVRLSTNLNDKSRNRFPPSHTPIILKITVFVIWHSTSTTKNTIKWFFTHKIAQNLPGVVFLRQIIRYFDLNCPSTNLEVCRSNSIF